MSKNFIELLEEMDKDELVYVGTKDGSNWIVIETVQTVLEKMDKVEKMTHDQVLRTLKRSKTNIHDYPYKIVELHEKIDKCKDDKERGKLEYKLHDLESRFAATYHTYRKTKQLLSKWIKLPDRKIVETYPIDVENPGTAILLEGSITGSLWFKGEKKVI